MLTTLSEIPVKPQEWVWKGVIPEGQLTLLMGEPGVGKSLFAMDAIARLTWGRRGLSDTEQGEPGSVVLFSGEDDFARVVRSRLESAGADFELVNVVENDTNLTSSDPEYERSRLHENWQISNLESHLTGLRESDVPCRLVVIDPANCFLDATDGRHDSQAREMVAKLADLAIRSDTAILLVAKPSRVEKGKRGGWSSTTPVLAEAARSVWTIVGDPQEPGRRMLLPVKTNLCETPPGLAFTIRDQRICWEQETVAQTADQYLAETVEQLRLLQLAAESDLSRAADWLKVRLSNGEVYSSDLIADATDNDISTATLRRALTLLGCRKGKEKKVDGRWYWRLPAQPKSPEATPKQRSSLTSPNPEPAGDFDLMKKLLQS